MRTYRITTESINFDTVVRGENCNSITFKNTGTAIAYVKGVPLQQYETLEISGNECEQDATEYDIRFSTDAAQLWVIRKTYEQ